MNSGILGQSDPAAASLTDLYTCPPNTIATLKVIVSNRAAATTFKIAVGVDGQANQDRQELASDTPIGANEPGSTVGFIISGDDVVRVSSASGSVSFTATGEERAE